ncbi:sigma-54-dependent Fis family transcriptional regulator [Paracoccus sp. SCSIO 75233]|uniref:sigma-54-dependent Fis family transcriptional regulator n=1 Tax=Paracoccus sp. SCSIO 75233 TaxID=3017782 RepID=UPI0022F0258A|nr:sigma 54-interacting transcriptional regulator [Paracoccus sp. SCSIO 75233]WBU53582.1 sigma 54-interacting transcriptional regulator [Paracoccus sp. SCSIO 75233]
MPHSITKDDWEAYVISGRAPANIRREILASWQRCTGRGQPSLKQAPQLAEQALLTQRAQARRLRNSARTALRRAGVLLDGSSNILLLCDRSGVVLDAVGDAETLDRGRENHLHLGGDWSEEVMGTNAIGTAIHMRRPVLITAAEHYCEEIQRWSCAATPIADPATGELLGVLDISWRSGLRQASAAALSAALAAQVESDLTRRLARERELLMERLQMSSLRRGGEPVLVMDRSGADVLSSPDFARFCEDDEALSTLRARVPQLIDQRPDAIVEALGGCLPNTEMEVVSRHGEAIGVMLSLRRGSRRPIAAGAELGEIGRIGSVTGALCAQAQRLARTRIPILIEGETGTGKTYLARAIHQASGQSEGDFELLECALLTMDGLRDDLAGISRRGFASPQGTLCLNGPGSTPPEAQRLLLTLVEQASEAGVRIITLSGRSLLSAMQAGQFRSDLYYHIAGARLHVPPLRERREEIAPLLRSLVRKHAAGGGRELNFTSGAMAVLNAYAWPGNLREMGNLIAALDALSMSGLIDEKSLPPEIRRPVRPEGGETLRDREQAEIIEAIEREDGNLTRVARRLGIARSTLYLKLDAYGIPRTRRS